MEKIPNIYTSDFQYGNVSPHAVLEIKKEEYIGYTKFNNYILNMFELIMQHKLILSESPDSTNNRGIFILFFIKFLLSVNSCFDFNALIQKDKLLPTSKIENIYKYYNVEVPRNRLFSNFFGEFNKQITFLEYKFLNGKSMVLNEYIHIYKSIIDFLKKKLIMNINIDEIKDTLLKEAITSANYGKFIFYIDLILSIKLVQSVDESSNGTFIDFVYFSRQIIVVIYIILYNIQNKEDVPPSTRTEIKTGYLLYIKDIFQRFFKLSDTQISELENPANVIKKLNSLSTFDKHIIDGFILLYRGLTLKFVSISCISIFRYFSELVLIVPPFESVDSQNVSDMNPTLNLGEKTRAKKTSKKKQKAPKQESTIKISLDSLEYKYKYQYISYFSIIINPIAEKIQFDPILYFINEIQNPDSNVDEKKINRFIDLANKMNRIIMYLNVINEFENFAKINILLYVYFIFQNRYTFLPNDVRQNFNYLRESSGDLNTLFDSVELDRNTVDELYTYNELGREIVTNVSNFMLSLVYHYVNDYRYFTFFDEISFLDGYWFLEDLLNNFLLEEPQNFKLIEDYYNNYNCFILLFYYPLLHNYLSNAFVMSSISSNNFFDLDYNKNFLFHLVLITKKLYDNDKRNIFSIILIGKILSDDDEEFNHNKLYSRELRQTKLKEYEKKIRDTLSISSVQLQKEKLEHNSSIQKQNVNQRRLNVEISKNLNSLMANLNLSTANQTDQSESISAAKIGQTDTDPAETKQSEILINLEYRLRILKNKLTIYSQLEKVYESRPEFDSDPNFLLQQTTEISERMLKSLFDNGDKHIKYIHSQLNYGIDYLLCMSFFFNVETTENFGNNNVASLANKGNSVPKIIYYYNILNDYVSFIKILDLSGMNLQNTQRINNRSNKKMRSLGKKMNLGFKHTPPLKPQKKIIYEPNENNYKPQENVYEATENNFKKIYFTKESKRLVAEKKTQTARPTSSLQPKTIYNIVNNQKLLETWKLGTHKWKPVSDKTPQKLRGEYLISQQIFKNKIISDFYKKYTTEIHVTCIFYARAQQTTQNDIQYCGIYPHVTIICDNRYLSRQYSDILDNVDPTRKYENKSIIVHYGIFLTPFSEQKKFWYNLVNLDNNQERISINIRTLSEYTHFLMDFNAIAESVLNSFLRELSQDNIEYKYEKNILNKAKFNYKKPHCFLN
jgi:hypothetical protein